jgi:P4 family phage/plasmid primase-like protien
VSESDEEPTFVGGWAIQESRASRKLRQEIGNVRCVGDDWFVQENGIWLPRPKDEYRALALKSLPSKWRTHLRSIQVLNRVESEQQVRQSTFCGAAKFDKDGAVLVAVQNGTVRISRDGVTLLSTSPNYGFTAALNVAWDEDAKIDLFGRVLSNALPDPNDRDLLLDVIATALIPDCRYEAALVCQGETGTGKSTVITPIDSIFSTTCAHLSMADLCHPSGYKLAMLHNKMLNLSTELNALEMEDTGLFKQLISGESFTARPIYGRPFEMRSTAKFVFLANNLPRFKNGTGAEIRRLRFIRFTKKVTEPDGTLKDRVALEAPGVFVDLVYRAQALLGGRKLSEPGTFGQETVRRFAVSNDPVGQFVDRCCKIGPGYQCRKVTLTQAFEDFREEHGIPKGFDDSVFFRALYDRFHSIQKKRITISGLRDNALVGIDLKDDGDT